jgi:hypothetical protein
MSKAIKINCKDEIPVLDDDKIVDKLESVGSSIEIESNRGLRLLSELLEEQKLTNKLLRKIYNPE